MSITIFHNPRCSKSRQTLELIKSRGITPNVVEYLSSPPAAEELLRISSLLGKPLTDLLRRGESEFKDAADAVSLMDENALATWISVNPKVLERPIVVDDETGRAIVGRPPENVLTLL
jgi:arsenate reductase